MLLIDLTEASNHSTSKIKLFWETFVISATISPLKFCNCKNSNSKTLQAYESSSQAHNSTAGSIEHQVTTANPRHAAITHEYSERTYLNE